MTNTQLFWLIVGLLWTGSELLIALSSRQQRSLTTDIELSSEKYIWLVICLSLLFALIIKNFHYFTINITAYAKLSLGFAFLTLGVCLRVYAVLCLGSFFSTQLSIQSSHKLINKGPYRYIRHPSYTGLILGFTGAGIAMGDFLALLMLIMPLIYILLKRIHIEEPLLLAHFGKEYMQYCQQTKKLIPGLY